MKKLFLLPLLSFSLVFSIVQTSVQAQYAAAKTIGLTVTAAGFTFLTAAYVQYACEQKLAAASSALNANQKDFKFSYLNHELLSQKTASIKKFLTFATKIYFNAHRPSTYNATFEAYPKLTTLAWLCDVATFTACVKSYFHYKKTIADETELAERIAIEIENNRCRAESKKKLDEKTAHDEEEQKKLNEKKARDEEEQKKLNEKKARDEEEQKKLDEDIKKKHPFALKKNQESLQSELAVVSAALAAPTVNEAEKKQLKQSQEELKIELAKTNAEVQAEKEKAHKATLKAQARLAAANSILNVKDTRLVNGKQLTERQEGAAVYLGYRTEQSAKGRVGKVQSDHKKLVAAQNACDSAKAEFDAAEKEVKNCIAVEAGLNTPSAKK